MIDFGKPFVGGWQCLVSRLFSPFDFGKWLVLGFALFLASFLDGSNPTLSWGGHFWDADSIPSLKGDHPRKILEQWPEWAGIAGLVGAGILGFWLVLIWLGARGQFVLLDNVVHNRFQIVAPWKAFRGPANRLFGFYVLVSALMLVLIVLEIAAVGAMAWNLTHTPGPAEGVSIVPTLVVGGISALSWIPILAFFFLYLEMGIPIIYHQRGGPLAAAMKIGQLIRQRPGDILVYLLLRFVMGFVLLMAFYFIGFFTCCIGFIIMGLPYVGSVLTLPVALFRIGFTLDCLAQFGPEYNVWSQVEPPTLPQTPEPPALS